MRGLCNDGNKTLNYNTEAFIVVGKGVVHRRTGRDGPEGDYRCSRWQHTVSRASFVCDVRDSLLSVVTVFCYSSMCIL
jgi:hypothetical protein